MSSISNRFFVTALDDGTTLHGSLSSTLPLSQGWDGTSATPDWTVAANQPIIYLTLLNGNEYTTVSSGYTWKYNGTTIVFDPSTNISSDGKFLKTTYTLHGTSVVMPALKIIDNLARANVDIDTITFTGTYSIGGSNVGFSATAQIRISEITANGYLGVINFVNGIADITQKNQVLTLYGTLYGGSNGGVVSGFTTKWYLNNGTATAGANKTVDGTTYANAYQVSEGSVTDHATVRCEFLIGTDVKFVAYVGIDDMQDPEYMYIQYNGANGNAASLHKDETASFQIWVGTRDDPSVLGGASTPTYSVIKVQLLNGSGQIITGTGLATNIPDPDAGDTTNYYRTLPMSGGKATITPHYNTVSANGKNITGIVIAYTSQS